MNERKFETALRELVEFQGLDEGGDLGIKECMAFEDCGILTSNKGLVVSLTDGTEFQLTIVRSKRGDAKECDECGEEYEAEGETYRAFCPDCIAEFERQDARAR